MINRPRIIRIVTSLALIGAVSVAARGSSIAHAAGPQISVTFEGVDSNVVVIGSGFGPGDPVQIDVGLAPYGEVTTQTTAAPTIPLCSFITGKCNGFKQGGYFTVETSAFCAEAVSVSAIDLTTHAASNLVQLHSLPC